ncbi:scarecrow-like protein 6 [Zingiber officinale]|uniref:scarecrow-like protein 6 n=1 Tax=Zingiber officinale TaxID=94328 RepID=UPI001C4C589A|nr:scarecrow-like protein 6 [Zingiber officinale]
MRGGTPLAVPQNGASLQVLEGEEGLLWCATSAMVAKRKEKGREKEKLLLEPRSVLESRRSPSPPSSSASTLSSSLVVGGGRSASSDGSAITATPSAAAEGASRAESTTELLPVPASLAGDLEGLFCEPAASIGQDQNFLGWIISEADDTSGGGNFDSLCVFEGADSFGCGIPNPNLGLAPSADILPLLLPPLPAELHLQDEKHLLPNQENQAQPPQLFPSFFLPFHQQSTTYHRGQPWKHLAPPTRKRPAVDPFPTSRAPELLCQNVPHQMGFRRQLDAAGFQLQPPSVKPKLASGDEPSVAAATPVQQQQRALFDQLFEVAELIVAGNTFSARGILARLNHQLPSPLGKPLLRSAFYFKEALHLLASNSPQAPPPVSTPLDALLKFATYKTFSDVSPIAQFTSLTCVQAILEALDGATCIHIIDFDIGIGVQWSALMQELVHRCSSAVAAPPYLKITAFTSPCSHHPLELHLIHQNLLQFARGLGLVFEFNILDLDPFDPSALLRMRPTPNEAVAVNLPVGSSIDLLILDLLRFVKQLSPKILVSVDYGYDRIDLPYGHNILSSIRSCILLLDSIDAAGTNPDAANKIERFLVRPRIQNAVFRHLHLSNKKAVSWRHLFSSAGFVPVQFSNITETQAECLLKRVLVQGFSVDRSQTSLSLCWKRGELASVSAWK